MFFLHCNNDVTWLRHNASFQKTSQLEALKILPLHTPLPPLILYLPDGSCISAHADTPKPSPSLLLISFRAASHFPKWLLALLFTQGQTSLLSLTFFKTTTANSTLCNISSPFSDHFAIIPRANPILVWPERKLGTHSALRLQHFQHFSSILSHAPVED